MATIADLDPALRDLLLYYQSIGIEPDWASLGVDAPSAQPSAAPGSLASILQSSVRPGYDEMGNYVGQPPQAPLPGAPSAWASQRGLGDLERRVTTGTTTPQDINFLGQTSSVAPDQGAQPMWNDFVARTQDREQGNGPLGISEARGDSLGDALKTVGPAVAIGTGVAGLADAAAVPATSGTTTTLQQILDSAQVPTISQGVNVAQAGGELPAITIPPAASAPAVDLTSSTLPQLGYGAQGGGVLDFSQSGIANVLAGAGGAGSALVPALTTGAGTAAATQALSGSGSEPAPAPDPTNFNNTTPGMGTVPDPNSTDITGSTKTDQFGMPIPSAGSTVGSIGGTKLSDILSGKVGLSDLASAATLGDLGRVLGTGAATVGSVAADSQRAAALKDLSDKYMALGAPSRARYEASFAPGFKPTDIPGFQGALDTGADAILRRMSTGGNPFGNPGQLTEAMNYLSGNLALPAVQQYRNQNAATGGFGAFNTAAPGAATGAIGATGDIYSDFGRGAGDIFNPPTDLARLLRQYGGGGASARGLT